MATVLFLDLKIRNTTIHILGRTLFFLGKIGNPDDAQTIERGVTSSGGLEGSLHSKVFLLVLFVCGDYFKISKPGCFLLYWTPSKKRILGKDWLENKGNIEFDPISECWLSWGRNKIVSGMVCLPWPWTEQRSVIRKFDWWLTLTLDCVK